MSEEKNESKPGRGGARPGTGGARPGAGRPRKDKPGTEARQVRMTVAEWELVDRIVAEQNAADPENATTANQWIADKARAEFMRRKYHGRGVDMDGE